MTKTDSRPTTLNLFEREPGRNVRRQRTGLGVDEAIRQYLEYLHAVGRRSPATISAYRSDMSKFRAFLGEGRDTHSPA